MAYRNKKQQANANNSNRESGGEENSHGVITVDYERYAHFLEDSDLTEEQKREFLQTLWNIIVNFVDLGFGVHPLQQAEKPCGKLKENSSEATLTAHDAIYLDPQLLVNNYTKAADPEAANEGPTS